MPRAFSPPFQENQIAHLPLTNEDRQFLLTTGLPEASIACLYFHNMSGTPLARVPERWEESNPLRSSLMHYYTFGHAGGGNPICFDAHENCRVVLLDHEDGFRPVWINEHITEFAACLAALQDAFDAFEEAGGDPDALFDEGFEPARYDQLTATFARIDEKTLTQGFWRYTLDGFRPQ